MYLVLEMLKYCEEQGTLLLVDKGVTRHLSTQRVNRSGKETKRAAVGSGDRCRGEVVMPKQDLGLQASPWSPPPL